MSTERSYDPSQLERELELYLGKEFEDERPEVDAAYVTDILTFFYPDNPPTSINPALEDLATDMLAKALKASKLLDMVPRPASMKPGVTWLALQAVQTFWRTQGKQRIDEKARKTTALKYRSKYLLVKNEIEMEDRAEDSEVDDIDEMEAGFAWTDGDDSAADREERLHGETDKLLGIDDLAKGDIILSLGTGWYSPGIANFTKSLVSHSALYIGKGMVVEAVHPEGLSARSIQDALADDKSAYVLRMLRGGKIGLTEEEQAKIVHYAWKQQQAKNKKKFDIEGMFINGALGLPGGTAAKFFCSEFINIAYKEAHIHLYDSKEPTPGDFDRLKGVKLTFVGHLKFKSKAQELDAAEELDEDPADSDWEVDGDAEGLEDDEFQDEFDELELDAMEDSGVEARFARELRELSDRSFESESDLDDDLDRGLEAMEEEYFVKRLHRRRRKGKGKKLFGKILRAGAKIAGKIAEKTPVGSLVKASTSLIRGDAKGALKSLAKAAVGAALGPVAGTVATAALDALGGEEGEVSHRRRRATRSVARIARDTFRELADTLPEDYDHPFVQNEIVRRAVRRAMIRNHVTPPQRHPPRRRHPLARRPAGAVPRRVIHVKPDEEVLLIGGE